MLGIGAVTPSLEKPRVHYTETGFRGPFPLDRFLVEVLVEGTGVYALVERSPMTGDLVVVYVGRGQLRRRLIAHAIAGRAELFVVRRVQSTVTAFRRECRMYLRYGRALALDNRIVPARPWRGLERCGAQSR